MSSKKFEKDFCQRWHTLIPLPPYRGYLLSDGLEHLRLIASQIRYSGIWLKPWLVRLFRAACFFKHPQDDVLPDLTFGSRAVNIFPQKHLKTKILTYLFCGSSFTITKSLILSPGAKFNFIIIR